MGDFFDTANNSSKVLDENGEPLVVYHGSKLAEFYYENGLPYTRWIERFNVFNAGKGFFTSDMASARNFGRGNYGLYQCFLNMRNPLVVDAQGEYYDEIPVDGKKLTTDEIVYRASQSGNYDGVVIRNVKEPEGRSTQPITDYVPFDPAQIKSATDNVGSFDPADGDIRFQMSRKVREQVGAWLAKREDMTEEEREAILDYIDEEVEGRKEQLAAGWWAAKGTVRLPEDMDKVRQAVAVAERKHGDIYRYSSPMELIDALGDIKAKERPIDPETVATLHRSRELAGGIVVYDVDEGEESRRAMRQIINTHFGNDCSPWCLLQGDGEGNLTEDSAQYWQHYDWNSRVKASLPVSFSLYARCSSSLPASSCGFLVSFLRTIATMWNWHICAT